jgi:cytochrome oxidase Cu insertion factor (SCO1/SenC/PrrC family)
MNFLKKLKTLQILFACSLLIAACTPKQEEKKVTVTPVNQLINLTIVTPAGEQISLRNLEGKNMFVFFNADCDHCQREATEIQNHLESFKNYSLYFISSDSPEDQQKFAKAYKLEGEPNVFFGRTEPMFIYQTVGSIPTPSMYIYSEERRLKKQFNGETPIEEVIQAL